MIAPPVKITPSSSALISNTEIVVTTRARDLHEEKSLILEKLRSMGYEVNEKVFWKEGGLTAQITFPIRSRSPRND